ncbi:hypothetical protein E2986_07062 [Frieseomelitta varia]|uniref:Odorant receptor 13a n=1 Tax=Frieseomelitta varia TaxID=561572 RepID=A0A833VX92_9HYME|nr:hypothetical protein E2986_07062 [Frieseomelitta varia]
MRFTGIWPEERKWNKPSSYVVLIPCFMMLCFGCGPQTVNLPFIAHDLNLVVENLSMANMTVTISLVKTITFWIHGKPLKFLLKCIAEDWATTETKTERETMVNVANIVRKATISCTMVCELVAVFYVSLRLFFLKSSDNNLIYRGYFLYNTSVSPNYELTMIGQALAAVYGAAVYAAVDTFIAMLVLHACGQLSNLKNDLKTIHLYDRSDFQEKLKKIVDKHNYISGFAETIENCFNLMLLFQMLGCIIQLCFQCFQAIMSTDVANTAYNCQWYSLPPKDARLFIIIMCRARSSPLMITAGKFCWFTILLYSQVLKTSMSYISVLYAMQNLNYHIGLNRYILKYTGIWPEERKWNRSSSYHVLVPSLTMLCFVCAPQTINLPLIAHDMNLLVENLSMGNMTITIALFLLKCIAEDWATAETKERETMMNIARLTRITTIGCIWLCELVAITYVSLRFISMKYTDNIMVYRGYFPYNITYSPNYELTMIGQTLGAIYGGTTYAAVDTFIAMLVLHACGQLSNLKDSLRNIHSYDKKDLQARLKKIVERHNYIAWFFRGNDRELLQRDASDTNDQLHHSTMFPDFPSYHGTKKKKIIRLSLNLYFCKKKIDTFYIIIRRGSSGVHDFRTYIPDYLCGLRDDAIVPILLRGRKTYVRGISFMKEKLISRCLLLIKKKNLDSTDIADTAYHCEWYNLPPEKARLFVIIMSRARTSPLRITAGKFCWFTIILYSQSLLRCIAKDWATVETKTERERMVNIAKISRKTMVACTSMCEFVAIFFLFLRLFLMKRNDSKSLILQGYFPYNTTISPNFELTEIAQAIAIIYTAASYSAVDTFVAMLVLHACGQLSNIKHDLRNVHSCGNSNVLQMKLKKIARKHDYYQTKDFLLIIPYVPQRFAGTVENCFNVMLLIQMLGCIVQLCFQSFQAIMVRKKIIRLSLNLYNTHTKKKRNITKRYTAFFLT